jgi:type I restriction enzyme S subunit
MTQIQKQNVPKLRFSEFEEDWGLVRGEAITNKITKGSSPKWQGFAYASSGCLFVTSENVRDGFLDVSKPKFLPMSFFEKQKNSQLSPGDILINIVGASIGRCCAFEDERPATINQAVALFRVNNRHSRAFISYCYQQDRIQKTISGTQSESARPNISLTDLRDLQFIIPTLPEQRKIAGFLGAIDTKIGQLSEKKRLLGSYKKGCMQQLFSQRTRFKDDNEKDFPDWEDKKLGELVKVTTGSSNREDSEDVGEYAFFDRSNDVRWSSKYLFDCEAIIVAGEGKDFPSRYFKGKFDLHQRAYAITDFGINSANFLFYWINRHRSHFLKFSVGSTMPSLRMSAFEKFPVALPHPNEQQKIADFLSAIDRKIDLVGQELSHARTYKQGLLQQMFV